MYKINKSSNNLHTDEFHIYYFMKFKKYKHLNQPNNYIVKNKIWIETLNFFLLNFQYFYSKVLHLIFDHLERINKKNSN